MQQWHDDTRTDIMLKRGVSSVVILGAFLSAFLWLSAALVTVEEAEAMDKAAVEQMSQQMEDAGFAKKSDIDSVSATIINMMVQEKIKDARNDIQEIDDKIIDEDATPADLKKRSRLLKDINEYETEKVE